MLPNSIRLQNFQSFDGEGAEINAPKRFNVFVGPNNVGKSKLLQCFERLRANSEDWLINRSGSDYRILFEQPIGTAIAQRHFPSNTNGGWVSGNHWETIGKHLQNCFATLEISKDRDIKKARLCEILVPENANFPAQHLERVTQILSSKRVGTPEGIISGDNFFYIASERDVLPENERSSAKIESNGRGVTAMIQSYLLSANQDTTLVREYILKDLNKIMFPNYEFKDIRSMKIDSTRWEIFLTTENHGDVALSQSGSGLKTALHLLSNIHLVLKANDESISSGLYLFEELENSLHPRMQRNIYKYIREKFTDKSICIFSTHSPIAIDFFQSDEDVSIYDVSQVSGNTKCRRINAFDDKVGALDALGVKASSALQSNFVIWVEGPTDRIYLKKWLEFVSGGEAIENRDYVIMFYGGKLLSHLTVSEDDEITELIRLLKINTKCAVLIDSDRSSEGTRIRGTKRRISQEARANSLMCWVTKGREIENYISPKFWADHFNVTQKETGQFNKVFEVVKGKRTKKDKPIHTKIELAAYVEENISANDLVLDWENKTKELWDRITEANT